MRKVDKNQEVMEKRLVYKKKGEKEEEKENLARSHTVPAEEEYNPGMLNAPPPPFFCVCVFSSPRYDPSAHTKRCFSLPQSHRQLPDRRQHRS